MASRFPGYLKAVCWEILMVIIYPSRNIERGFFISFLKFRNDEEFSQ